MNLLAIGTDVVMSEQGKNKYLNESSNPHNRTGKVISNDQAYTHIYIVKWNNGRSNSYCIDEIISINITVTQEELDSLL